MQGKVLCADQPVPGIGIGVMFIPGAGYRVCVEEDGGLKHMGSVAARRVGRELAAEDGVAEEVSPVCKALLKAANVLDGLDAIGCEVTGRG